jgi:general secretion pathway protein G
MKRILIGLAGALAIAAAGASTSPASAQTAMDFYSRCGNGMTAGVLNRGYCHSYVTGLVNGLVAGGSGLVCLPAGVTDTQLVMVVQNYMRSHPERLNQSATAVIGQAVTGAFPCQQPNALAQLDRAMVRTARTEISNLAAGLDLFKYDVGRYPTAGEGLEALVSAPPGVKNWHGPYVKRTMSFTDPWGNPYHYVFPGNHGEFDLFSYGARAAQNETDAKPVVANW